MTDYERRFDPFTGEPIQPQTPPEQPAEPEATPADPSFVASDETGYTQDTETAAPKANPNYTTERPFEPDYTAPGTDSYSASEQKHEDSTYHSAGQQTQNTSGAPFSDPNAFRPGASYAQNGTAQNVYTGGTQSYYQPQPQKPQKPHKPKKALSRSGAVALVVICLVLSLILSVFGSMLGAAIITDRQDTDTEVVNEKENDDAENSGTVAAASDKLTMADTKSTDALTVAQIADKVGNSVVEIVTEYVQQGFRTSYTSAGAGSGVVLSADGYIVTNNHVIADADTIHVRMKNGDYYEAKLIGTDSTSDVAILKIEASGLTPALIGDSSKLVVGESCVAVGNPLGTLGGTVTNGIISALDREITIDGETMTLLQTNAAVNPGNSGGGLFDNTGTLIGIVNAKSSGTDVEGLGFAIPINTAVPIISDLMEDGYVHGRFALGVTLVTISNYQTAMYYGVEDYGVYIYAVNKNSNAEKAGLKSGDLIISIDGTKVATSEEVKALLDKKEAGDTMEFVVNGTDQKERTVTVTLTETTPDSAEKQ